MSQINGTMEFEVDNVRGGKSLVVNNNELVGDFKSLGASFAAMAENSGGLRAVSCSSSCSNGIRFWWLKRARNRWLDRRNELKTVANDLGGRDRSDFGTVRPRVQIPGSRPLLYSKSAIPGVVSRQVQAAGSQIFAEVSKRDRLTLHLPSRASLTAVDRNRWPCLHSKPGMHGP